MTIPLTDDHDTAEALAAKNAIILELIHAVEFEVWDMGLLERARAEAKR